MRSIRWVSAAAVGLLAVTAARADEAKKITGQILDAPGKPAADVEVAPYWHFGPDGAKPFDAAKTDAAGRFSLEFDSSRRGPLLLALDKDRKRGGVIVLEPTAADKPVALTLEATVHVHGQFSSKELGKRPAWTNVYVSHSAGRGFLLGCDSREAAFSFRLPPGQYQFRAYGSDVQDHHRDLALSADRPDVDLGTIDLQATIIARHVGKAPPAWTVTDARGAAKDVKLSDCKGKWVLVEFWGFW
jgi:hypothetical protein